MVGPEGKPGPAGSPGIGQPGAKGDKGDPGTPGYAAFAFIGQEGFVSSNLTTTNFTNANVTKPNGTTGLYCIQGFAGRRNFQVTPVGQAARFATVVYATAAQCDTYAPYILMFDANGQPADAPFFLAILGDGT